MGTTLITLSIVLAFALVTLGKDYLEDNTMNTIKVEIMEKHNVKSNEIDYIRKFNNRFYEITLDNGDVYTFKKDEHGKTIMKHIKDKNKELNIDDK